MITKLKETEATSLSPADIDQYLESTNKVHILYKDRSILEICKSNDDLTDKAGGVAVYKVVYKDYEPLGCCDDWSSMGLQCFDLSKKDEAIASFLNRLHSNPEGC